MSDTPMEERAVMMVMQAIPGDVTVPDARRILDAVRAFAREQDAIRAELEAALEEIEEWLATATGTRGGDWLHGPRYRDVARAALERAR